MLVQFIAYCLSCLGFCASFTGGKVVGLSQWNSMCCGPSCVFISLCVRKELQVLKEVFALAHEWKSSFISVSREWEKFTEEVWDTMQVFCYGLENSLLLILQKANEIQVESDFNVFEWSK